MSHERCESLSSLEDFEESNENVEENEILNAVCEFTDLELPDPLDFQQYDYKKEHLDVLRYQNGDVYEGKSDAKQLRSGDGTLYDKEREQYVQGKWRNNKLIKLNSAQFKIKDDKFVYIYAQNKLIVIDEHNFIARLSIKSQISLECDSFLLTKNNVYEQIAIEELWNDDLTMALKPARQKFEAYLQKLVAGASLDKVAKNDIYCVFQLRNEAPLLDDSKMNVHLLKKLYKSEISQNFKLKINAILPLEQSYVNRNKQLPELRIREFSWKAIFETHVQDALRSVKQHLLSKVPSPQFVPNAANDINSFSTNQIFILKTDDIQLFSDIEFTIRQHSYLNESIKTAYVTFFSGYISSVWRNLVENLTRKKKTPKTLTKPVFLQLFKTFLDLLVTLAPTNINNVISKDMKGTLKIVFSDTDATVNKLKFFVKAMHHFQPGDLSTKAYAYKFNYFAVKDKKSWIYSKIDAIKNYVVSTFSVLNIQDDYLIWLYYIHDCFDYMINKEHLFEGNAKDLILYVNSLLDMFKSIVSNESTTFERLRILSESIVGLVRSLCQHFKENPLDSETEIELLMQQSHYLTQFDERTDNYCELIASVIETYQVYWEQRIQLKKELFTMYSVEPLQSVCVVIIESTTSLLETAFQINIHNNNFVVFLRSFNEFHNYLRATKFPWYVKNSSSAFVSVVNEDKQSYVVNDVRKFMNESYENKETEHYMLSIVISLINCAENFLKTNRWSDDNKMQALSDLILAMGRSFKNYSEQSNYEDFQMFFKASTEPFDRVTTNAKTVEDFRKRVEILENYYVYTRNLNVMNLDKTLKLCYVNSKLQTGQFSLLPHLNYTFNKSELIPSYNLYEETFNSYVEQYISKLKTLEAIVSDIKRDLSPKQIKKWTNSYKTTTIPVILAGLSAVWSLLTSCDVIGQKFIIKPYSVQILCILRLLGVDQVENGFLNHLAQVLTGQGKSLILAMLASILALTSNKVRIVCYNEYLAERDNANFRQFFELFGVKEKINYGTFEDMADEVLKPRINANTYNIRSCIAGLVTGTLKRSVADWDEVDTYADTVLIIDEVDVFFSPLYYGNIYSACDTIESKSFTSIQLKIWSMALNNCAARDIKACISDYVEHLIKEGDDTVFVNIYTKCQHLLYKNIDLMIEEAINVKNGTINDWYINKYKLDNDGHLVYVKNDGRYSKTTYCSYYNVFNYLRLKKLDGTKPKDFQGYLHISCGAISYAILPNEYKHILGVTGTLTSLSQPEVQAVKSYNINTASDMPSFFGRSKLISLSMNMLDTEDKWKKAILDSVMKKVNDERAVLVFFDTELQIEKVLAYFKSHLQCVSVLTGNEDKKSMEMCIENAGIKHYVTLATRRMGRGIDFKSNDSHVERQGGIHVIQTFFSDDLKEEIQIKGRTARNENEGSYQLIICHPHLKNDDFEADSDASYNTLNSLRKSKAMAKVTTQAENIEKSRKKHNLTIDLLKSFSTYDPAYCDRYFTSYPFVDIDE